MKSVYLFLTTCFFLFLTAPLAAQNGQPADSCLGNTFIRVLGEPGSSERGIALCPAGDGNIYVTGSKPDSALLFKISPNGDIIWARSFDFLPGYDNITSLIVDSEGMLVGCGQSCTCFSGSQNSFLFRYNPQTDAFLWISRPNFFNTPARACFAVREKLTGENYLLAYKSPVGPAVIMEVDRNTGMEVPGSSWRYDWSGGESYITSFEFYESFLYAVGIPGFGSMGLNRQSLICIDTVDGQPAWSQLNHLPLSEKVELRDEDILIDDNAVLSVLWGNETDTSQAPDFAFLQKTALDGEILWLKKYAIPGINSLRATELIRANDGYVIFGTAGVAQGYYDQLIMLKTDLNGDALWARISNFSTSDEIFRANPDREFLEMDGFFYFTGYSDDAQDGTDLLLVKLNADGFVSDSCNILIPAPVETIPVLNPVSETPALEFQKFDIESMTPIISTGTAIPQFPEFLALCERVCEQEKACDIKVNNCVTFELLGISVDAAGDRHYRVRFSNACAGQQLKYLAIQVPDGTVATDPQDGSTYTTAGGRNYTVRNPNFSPFYSIRFSTLGDGIGLGESDEFEYVISGQTQPDYIYIFARLTPGPSYEAHLNVFNCPVEYQNVQFRSSTAQTQAFITPNPASNVLSVTLPESGAGQWQIFGIAGQMVKNGIWKHASRIDIPVAELTSGLYCIRLYQEGKVTASLRFMKLD